MNDVRRTPLESDEFSLNNSVVQPYSLIVLLRSNYFSFVVVKHNLHPEPV